MSKSGRTKCNTGVIKTNVLKLKRNKQDEYQDKIKELISFDDNTIEKLFSDASLVQDLLKLIPTDGNLKIELFFSEAYEDLTIDCYLITITVLGQYCHEHYDIDTTFKTFMSAFDFITCEFLSIENKGSGLQLQLTDSKGATAEEMDSDGFRGMVTLIASCELKVV